MEGPKVDADLVLFVGNDAKDGSPLSPRHHANYPLEILHNWQVVVQNEIE